MVGLASRKNLKTNANLVFILFVAIFSYPVTAHSFEALDVKVSGKQDGCKISKLVQKYYGKWYDEPIFPFFFGYAINGYKKVEKYIAKHEYKLLLKIVRDKDFIFHPGCKSNLKVTFKIERVDDNSGDKVPLYRGQMMIFQTRPEDMLCIKKTGIYRDESKKEIPKVDAVYSSCISMRNRKHHFFIEY